MGKARKRSHGAGTVFARRNGSFTAQITDRDGRRSIGTFPSRFAAERALAKALVDGPPPSIDATFGEYLTASLEDQALLLKATTAARNRNIVNRPTGGGGPILTGDSSASSTGPWRKVRARSSGDIRERRRPSGAFEDRSP